MHLQLALYAEMRRQETGAWPELAYFIIDDASLYAQTNVYFSDVRLCAAREEGVNVATLWQSFLETWRWRKQQLEAGNIEVPVLGTEPDDDSIPPEGAFKPSETVNRDWDSYASLTGWGEGA